MPRNTFLNFLNSTCYYVTSFPIQHLPLLADDIPPWQLPGTEDLSSIRIANTIFFKNLIQQLVFFGSSAPMGFCPLTSCCVFQQKPKRQASSCSKIRDIPQRLGRNNQIPHGPDHTEKQLTVLKGPRCGGWDFFCSSLEGMLHF